MQAMVHGYERKDFTSSKGVWGFQRPRININYSSTLFLVIIMEKVTYNLVNLKDQNSINIGHNVNPTFFMMNNQSKFFLKTLKAFLDTLKDMKLDFFSVDFWHLLCLSSIETSFAPLRIDRHSPSIPLFFCFYVTFLNVLLDGPQSMAFLLLALSQSLNFCSKPFFYPLIISVSS